MGFFRKYLANTRKPEGFLGKMVIAGMNSGHARVAAWGMSKLPKMCPFQIADLGCGGGKNAQELMKRFPSAHMTALDYSSVSVEQTRKRNLDAVKDGKCKVVQGDVSALPLPSDTFDLVTAFETIYFWPGPEESFREVFRILKSGGYFALVNEADGTNPKDEKWVELIDGMRLYNESELRELLHLAGFERISAAHRDKDGWICVTAQKP